MKYQIKSKINFIYIAQNQNPVASEGFTNLFSEQHPTDIKSRIGEQWFGVSQGMTIQIRPQGPVVHQKGAWMTREEEEELGEEPGEEKLEEEEEGLEEKAIERGMQFEKWQILFLYVQDSLTLRLTHWRS